MDNREQILDKPLKSYLEKHFPLKNLFSQEPSQEEDLHFDQHKVSIQVKLFIYFLEILPWLCLAGFGISFFPFAETPYSVNLPFWRETIDFSHLIRIVSISGLIGFGTNRLAIRMLFRPVHRRPIWGQGLIPAQKDRIIFTLAKGMHDHILSQALIRKRLESSGILKRINDLVIQGGIGVLQDQELRNQLKMLIYNSMKDYLGEGKAREEIIAIIDRRVEENMEAGVKKFLLQTYKRYNREDYEEIIQKVIADIPKVSIEVLHEVEQELDRLAAYLRSRKKMSEEWITKALMEALEKIDIPGLLRGQMEHFDESRLEKMIRDATNEQLIYIQYLGALLGMLGGLLIWQPALMGTVFILIFALLYLIDLLIYHFKSRALERS